MVGFSWPCGCCGGGIRCEGKEKTEYSFADEQFASISAVRISGADADYVWSSAQNTEKGYRESPCREISVAINHTQGTKSGVAVAHFWGTPDAPFYASNLMSHAYNIAYSIAVKSTGYSNSTSTEETYLSTLINVAPALYWEGKTFLYDLRADGNVFRTPAYHQSRTGWMLMADKTLSSSGYVSQPTEYHPIEDAVCFNYFDQNDFYPDELPTINDEVLFPPASASQPFNYFYEAIDGVADTGKPFGKYYYGKSVSSLPVGELWVNQSSTFKIGFYVFFSVHENEVTGTYYRGALIDDVCQAVGHEKINHLDYSVGTMSDTLTENNIVNSQYSETADYGDA